MQVAATNPTYVAREDVPGDVVEKEREIYRGQMAAERKPPQVVDKIIEGKLERFFAEQCLLEQPSSRTRARRESVSSLTAFNAKTGSGSSSRRSADPDRRGGVA